jgi:exodeoxyribonuclease VII large subunit
LQFKNLKNSLQTTESRLRLLGPEQVLARGYSITMDAATGKIVRRAKDAKVGQGLKTRVKEGEIFSQVERNG